MTVTVSNAVPADCKTAYALGRRAAQVGDTRNPYSPRSFRFNWWIRGLEEGEIIRENAAAQKADEALANTL